MREGCVVVVAAGGAASAAAMSEANLKSCPEDNIHCPRQLASFARHRSPPDAVLFNTLTPPPLVVALVLPPPPFPVYHG